MEVIRLVYLGHQLKDEQILSEEGIGDQSTIHLVMNFNSFGCRND